MSELKIGLDALMLFVGVAYALSALMAGWPEPRRVEPAELVNQRRLRLFLPPLAALLLVLSAFWGHLLAEVGLATSHGWPVALQSAKPSDKLMLVLLLGWGGWGAWQVLAWARGRVRLSRLTAIADPAREAAVRRQLDAWGQAWDGRISAVASDVPLALVFGVRTPHLLLSTAVLESLSSQELQAVIAHEQAHVQRRDNAWRFLGQLALFAHLPGVGNRLFTAWSQAAEGACDALAARALGSPVLLAEALLHFRRLQELATASPKSSIYEGARFAEPDTLAPRVRWLLAEPPLPASSRFRLLWLWLLLPLAVWQADWMHRHLESVLRWLHR